MARFKSEIDRLFFLRVNWLKDLSVIQNIQVNTPILKTNFKKKKVLRRKERKTRRKELKVNGNILPPCQKQSSGYVL